MLTLFMKVPIRAATVPFEPGEKLTYTLKWSVIPAGEASLEVLPYQTIDGIDCYHFRLTAKSNAFIDMFYKVRERIDAFTDTAMTRSILYQKRQIQGRANRQVEVKFDWQRRRAEYYSHGKHKGTVPLETATFDPLGIFYFSRLLDLKLDTTYHGPVTDGRRVSIGKAYIRKRETIVVGGQAYDTLLIEPDLHNVKGVFDKSPDAKIQVWVTADARHIPVRIKSKVAVGSFTGELQAVSGVAPAALPNP
jgi:hypothetical protein